MNPVFTCYVLELSFFSNLSFSVTVGHCRSDFEQAYSDPPNVVGWRILRIVKQMFWGIMKLKNWIEYIKFFRKIGKIYLIV